MYGLSQNLCIIVFHEILRFSIFRSHYNPPLPWICTHLFFLSIIHFACRLAPVKRIFLQFHFPTSYLPIGLRSGLSSHFHVILLIKDFPFRCTIPCNATINSVHRRYRSGGIDPSLSVDLTDRLPFKRLAIQTDAIPSL